MKKIQFGLMVLPLSVVTFGIVNGVMAADVPTGYYASGKLGYQDQRADNMNLSARPGIGAFVRGNEKKSAVTGSIAAGYQVGNGWRTELEYTFPTTGHYTSGSTAFPTSFNHHDIRSERMMVNAYRDIGIGAGFGLYGTAGIGVSRVKSEGWQGNPSRRYEVQRDHNLTYAVGAGVNYTPEQIQQLSFDLGYRYVDMGNVQSGYNLFGNARGIQDEQLRAQLRNHEYVFGVRYLF
ncbi:outer membrane protein [Thorsellia anophelis]|uniref:Opacity protein n=1 Tax=Thorsellia anophelis DSM 18579 TaxID=1123402 RepID=A0A1I0DMW8_9GAMM|nr:outer membrane beta-barrel protein [Thorsellia anophelis]SET33848.1 Opacity protein [Thorsellia anophelis DSM 18579]